MAENTTTRVVEVQVDNAEAIKLIADYNAKIEESTAKEKALREAIKKKGEATAADREELAKLRAEQTAYKRELREVEKEVQSQVQAARPATVANAAQVPRGLRPGPARPSAQSPGRAAIQVHQPSAQPNRWTHEIVPA